MNCSTKVIIFLLVLNTLIHTAEIIIDLEQAGILHIIDLQQYNQRGK